MRLFKKKEEDEIQLHTYEMTIVFNNDLARSYKFTNVKAAAPEEAVNKMKHYVATNGYFGNMTKEAVIAKLSVIDIKEN